MSQTLVINSCYGGFGLSPRAVQRLAELRGQPCYLFTGGLSDVYVPATIEQCAKTMFWSAFTIPDPNTIHDPDAAEWVSMTLEERRDSNARHEAVALPTHPDNRADPLLVQVVRELGDEANGSCAELKVVEIPDGVKWVLSEYDGIERVEEEHQSWS